MDSDTRTIELAIDGMTCGSCVSHVEERLAAVEGVETTEVAYPAGTAAVTVGASVDATALIGALADTPYSATAVAELEAYGLAVIGGGSAGFSAAIRAVEKGARVVMINDGTIGGTCVNVGCVPSKAVIRAAEAAHTRAHHPYDGVVRSEDPVDWPTVRENKDALVEQLRTGKYVDVLAGYPEITLIPGRARLDEEARIHLSDGTTLDAERILIATGSSAWTPDVPGLDEVGYLDSTALLDIDALPDSLAVIGAGSVGLELAQAYSRMGVRVTILARSRLLSHGDPDVSDELARHLRDEGIEVMTGAAVDRVTREGALKRLHISQADGTVSTVDVQEILSAAGRRANTDGLGLDAAGVETDASGAVVVDDQMRTTNPRVYAAGDVTGEPMHVYVAAHAAAIAMENAFGGDERIDLSVTPAVTFTDPGVATVGLTEREAREAGIEPIVSKLGLEHVPRSLAARDTRGFVKLVADSATRRIVGAHIVASEAGEMIMEPAMAIRFGLTIEDITSMLHPYLTLSEGVKLAALTFEKDVATLSCCAV
jgi:mercuric reductase